MLEIRKEYVDKTCGVRSEANKSGFNHIVYTTWYMVARVMQGKFNANDLAGLLKHLDLNNDKYSLYAPKNSHDNITYKMILSQVFSLNREDSMSFLQAAKKASIFRPWDIITYGFMFGPKLLRPLFGLLMWIPALQMIHSCKQDTFCKVRPNWFIPKDFKASRILWWFKKKTLIQEDKYETKVVRTWEFKDGTRKETFYMQNDGKHLSVFRLYALKDKSRIMKWCAKKCRAILIEKYGEDYTYEIISRYFEDQKNPVIPMWKGHGDILK